MREWFYLDPKGKHYGPMPEAPLMRIMQWRSFNPDDAWGFSFRCQGSSKWIDTSTFLRLVDPEVGAPDFPSDFFDNPDEKSVPLFYPVSRRKFFLLSVCTCGLYYLYWEYRTWSYFRKIDIQSDKWYTPFFCTAFSIISPESLITLGYLSDFYDIGVGPEQMVTSFTSISFVRGALIALGLVALFPYARIFIIFPLLSSVAYLPLVKLVNDINAKRIPEYLPDDQFSLFQRVWIAFFIIVVMGLVVFLYSL